MSGAKPREGQRFSGRPPKTCRQEQCKTVEHLLLLWEAVAYLFGELHALLEVVIVENRSACGLLCAADRQGELETLVDLLFELPEQAPIPERLDDSLPIRYNAVVMSVCMAWNSLLAYPVPR
jgi:hypothetical protein